MLSQKFNGACALERVAATAASGALAPEGSEAGAQPSHQALCAYFRLAFPHDHNVVLKHRQRALGALVTHSIRAELVQPETAIARRAGRPLASGMTVPEATMDEDRPAPLAIRNVRGTRQVSVVGSEPVSYGPEGTTDGQFRRGVALPDSPEPGRGHAVCEDACVARWRPGLGANQIRSANQDASA